MAQRRMFSLQIVDTDAFLDMPPTSQLLYFHLSMRADDDGFVSNPKKIMKVVGSNDDDLKILFVKKFVLPFESGICVIKHWKIHNYIQNDRYKSTQYIREKALLEVEPETQKYQLKQDNTDVYKVYTQDRVRIELGKNNTPPTAAQEVILYFFSLKGWEYKGTPSEKKLFRRYLRAAKDLLELCEKDVPAAKECLDKISAWAKSRELDWSIETIFKKWYEIDLLKPKEKKPHYDGCRIFQKVDGGKWWIIRNGEVKELGKPLTKEEVIWK